MDVVCLSSFDRGLLRARWKEHDNSHLRMLDSLEQMNAFDAIARLKALRSIEKHFNIDLAEICHRHAARADAHPIEKIVLDFITEERAAGDELQLWIMPDRVKQVRELMDGKLVGPAQ
jgi:hypothetical protein